MVLELLQSVQMYESTRVHTQTLQNLYKHPLFLNRNQMAKSVGSSGDEARIQAFANKLISGGDPVTPPSPCLFCFSDLYTSDGGALGPNF